MAQTIKINFDDSDKVLPILNPSDTINFELAQGGNSAGTVIVASVNTPVALNFTSDFEQSSQSAVFDTTKFTKIWMTYDSNKSKVIYTLENLTAI